jgi:hypothetical protein
MEIVFWDATQCSLVEIYRSVDEIKSVTETEAAGFLEILVNL